MIGSATAAAGAAPEHERQRDTLTHSTRPRAIEDARRLCGSRACGRADRVRSRRDRAEVHCHRLATRDADDWRRVVRAHEHRSLHRPARFGAAPCRWLQSRAGIRMATLCLVGANYVGSRSRVRRVALARARHRQPDNRIRAVAVGCLHRAAGRRARVSKSRAGDRRSVIARRDR